MKKQVVDIDRHNLRRAADACAGLDPVMPETILFAGGLIKARDQFLAGRQEFR